MYHSRSMRCPAKRAVFLLLFATMLSGCWREARYVENALTENVGPRVIRYEQDRSSPKPAKRPKAKIECTVVNVAGEVVCRFQALREPLTVCAKLTVICDLDSGTTTHRKQVCSGWLDTSKRHKKRFAQFRPPIVEGEQCLDAYVGVHRYSFEKLPPSKHRSWDHEVDSNLLKLLVISAWDDGAVAAAESDLIQKMAADSTAPTVKAIDVTAGLANLAQASKPDVSVLYPHIERVVWEVELLHLADGKTAPTELLARREWESKIRAAIMVAPDSVAEEAEEKVDEEPEAE